MMVNNFSSKWHNSSVNSVRTYGFMFAVQTATFMFISFIGNLGAGLLFHTMYEAWNSVFNKPFSAVKTGLPEIWEYDYSLVWVTVVFFIVSVIIISSPWDRALTYKSCMMLAESVWTNGQLVGRFVRENWFIPAHKVRSLRTARFNLYFIDYPLAIFAGIVGTLLGHAVFSLWFELRYHKGAFFADLLWHMPRLASEFGQTPTVILLVCGVFLVPLASLTIFPMFFLWAIKITRPPFETYINFVLDYRTYPEKSRRLYMRPRTKWVVLYESYRFTTRIFWLVVLPTWVLATAYYYAYQSIIAFRYENIRPLHVNYVKKAVFEMWEHMSYYMGYVDMLTATILFIAFVLVWPSFIHYPLPRFWIKGDSEPWTIGEVSSRFIKGIVGVLFEWNTHTTYLMLWAGVYLGALYERVRVFGPVDGRTTYAWEEELARKNPEEPEEDTTWYGHSDTFLTLDEKYYARPKFAYHPDTICDPAFELMFNDYCLALICLLLVPAGCYFLAWFNYYLQQELGTWDRVLDRWRRVLVVFPRRWELSYRAFLIAAFLSPQSIFTTYIPVAVFLVIIKFFMIEPRSRAFRLDDGFHEITTYTGEEPTYLVRGDIPGSLYGRRLEDEMAELVSGEAFRGTYKIDSYAYKCPSQLKWVWDPIEPYLTNAWYPSLTLLVLALLFMLLVTCAIELIWPGSTGLDLNWYRAYRWWTLRGRYRVLVWIDEDWWRAVLKPVKPGSYTPDNSITWLTWTINWIKFLRAYAQAVDKYGDRVFVPRYRRLFKRLFVLSLFFWPDMFWDFMRLMGIWTIEGYYRCIYSERFMGGLAIFLLPAIFLLLYAAREFFFRETTGIMQYEYDDDIRHRVIDLKHPRESAKRMSYYEDFIRAPEFKGSLFSVAGFFHVSGRLLWGALWALISVWVPISMGVPVGSGFIFRPDIVYNLHMIPGLVWATIAYFLTQIHMMFFVGIVVFGQSWSAFLYFNKKSFEEIIQPRGQDRIMSVLDATALQLVQYVMIMWAIHCGYIYEYTYFTVDDEIWWEPEHVEIEDEIWDEKVDEFYMEIKKRDTQIDKEDAELLKWVEANMDKYMKIWRKCVSLNIEFIKRGMEDRVRIPPMRHHLDTGLDWPVREAIRPFSEIIEYDYVTDEGKIIKMSTLTEEYASYLEKKYLSAHEIYPQKFLLKGRWELLTKLDDYHKAYLREAYDDDVDDMFEDDLYMDLEFNWRLNKLNEAQELEHMHDGIYAIEHRQHKLFAGSEYSWNRLAIDYPDHEEEGWFEVDLADLRDEEIEEVFDEDEFDEMAEESDEYDFDYEWEPSDEFAVERNWLRFDDEQPYTPYAFSRFKK